MGERIKTLAKRNFLDSSIEVELNHPLLQGRDEQIHLQSRSFRLEMDKKDYIKCALTILLAEENLRLLKKLR